MIQDENEISHATVTGKRKQSQLAQLNDAYSLSGGTLFESQPDNDHYVHSFSWSYAVPSCKIRISF